MGRAQLKPWGNKKDSVPYMTEVTVNVLGHKQSLGLMSLHHIINVLQQSQASLGMLRLA